MKQIIVLILCMIGTANTNIDKLQLPKFDTEAHRGGRGLMPENTIPAMLHGLSLGVTTLEMDAVITKDGQVILSHEPFFNHDITTLPNGGFIEAKDEKNYNIYRMSYAETQQYDVGLKPNPRFPQQQKLKVTKPLLAEVIDSAEAFAKTTHRALPFYNIETKIQPGTDNVFHPAPEAFVTKLMKVITQKKIEARVIIQSFDPRSLQVLHRLYPNIKTALLIEGFDKGTLDTQLQQLGFTPTIYSPAYQLVNDAMIQACHQKGMKVLPWTVNDKPTIDRLKGMGVDGLISDYPNLFE